MSSQQDVAATAESAAPAALGMWRARALPVIWRFHPLIFLVLSFGMAGIAWPLLPRSTGREISASALYAAALADLRSLRAFDEALPLEERRQRATNAWVALDIMIRCCGDELAGHPEFVNPYLLRAEAARLLAAAAPYKQRERLEQALANYDEARRWEERWQQTGGRAEDEALYALSNYVDDKLTLRRGAEEQRALLEEYQQRGSEIKERRQRRLFYLRLRRAELAAELGWNSQAEEAFRALQRESQTSAAPGALLLPREFEAGIADLELIPYHLAMLYQKLGRLEEAQRELQRFLQAPRRREERFRALMGLAGLHLDAGRRALAAGGEAMNAEARRHLQIAADLYSQVPAEGAPETMLRAAYFLGGNALLLLAETVEEGRLTLWDTMAEARDRWQTQIAEITGKAPTEKMRRLPRALGALFWSEDTLLPQPSSLWRLPAAVLLLGGESGSRRQQRRSLISQARLFFEAAGGGDRRLALASQMMVGRTLLAEGQGEVARRLFRNTLATSQDPIIALACRHGEARSWLIEGRLDEAKARLLGGAAPAAAPELRMTEVDWVPLLMRIYEAGSSAHPAPGRRIWDFLSADEREIVRRVSLTRRAEPSQLDIMLQAFNGLLRRPDFYAEEYFSALTLPPAVRLWLERDRAVLHEEEIAWLNRLLLEAAFSREIASAPPPLIHPPFPAAVEIGTALALSAEDIGRDLAALFRAYLRRADAAEREAQTNREQPRLFARARRQQCRALDDALAVGYFLLEKYPPRGGSLAIEIGEASERLARTLSVEPFFNRERSRSLIAAAAATYLRASDDINYEEEALLRAGYGFYAAGRLERSVEVLRLYLDRYRTSDRAGAAQNLLGRALWGLGQLEDAAKVYRDNADRRTPEGHKSLYYLGAVFMEMEQSKGEAGGTIDRLGNLDEPLPRMEEKGPRIQTALQAFEFLRRLPDIAPDSRPWRWATFGLGLVKQRIAERAQRQAPQKPEAWLEYFRAAAEALTEGLERYPLKASFEGVGIDRELEPEDYWETMRARFMAEYSLARVSEVLGEEGKARANLAHLLDEKKYPAAMFEGEATRPTWLRPTLGVSEGLRWSADNLRLLQRNAYFLLGRLWLVEGERSERMAHALEADGKKAEGDAARQNARLAYEEAARVYQAAYDRLPLANAPRALYGQAECLRRLGKTEEAAAKYALAHSAARHRQGNDAGGGEGDWGADFWENMAAQRQKDLEEGYRK